MELEVSKVVSRIRNKQIHVTLNDAAKEFLIEKGYDPTYGRAANAACGGKKYLEDPLAEELLRGNIKDERHPGGDGKTGRSSGSMWSRRKRARTNPPARPASSFPAFRKQT